MYKKSDFRIDNFAMRYSNFVPRLFNYCLSIGMTPNYIIPSRAFCSDENQGYPIILIAKHFGTFPFNHGRVGGIVAVDRHAPHSHHGKDVVIIQASHVGYEPETGEFGIYRRLGTENHVHSNDCGAICNVLEWYKSKHAFARKQIKLEQIDGNKFVVIDNKLLDDTRSEGLFLNLKRLIGNTDKYTEPVKLLSTAKVFQAAPDLIKSIGENWPDKRESIDEYLDSDFFYFRRDTEAVLDASRNINRNLIKSMPNILSSKHPELVAAQVNTQVEFDRTFRSIITEEAYQGKNLLFISGIHIDISPREGQIFPLTKFVPWAAYIQKGTGESYTLEQDEIYSELAKESTNNPNKIDLTEVIGNM